jgi:AcrR family transcriptional regulator
MSDREAKERILQAAIALMDEVEDSDRITIRQIAERAGVGVGLINYHFQTREHLLYTAIGEYMTQLITAIQQAPSQGGSPVDTLKSMLSSLCDIGMRHEKQMRIGAQYQLQQGDFSAANFLLPTLRQVFAGKKDENAIRLIAFQILVTTNVLLLRSDAFFTFAGMDLRNKEQRNHLLDILIDNYLN